jgi:hypothetical protein
MSWRDIDDDWTLCQHLYRDDNVVIGGILRYYEDGSTYAWYHPGACPRRTRPSR